MTSKVISICVSIIFFTTNVAHAQGVPESVTLDSDTKFYEGLAQDGEKDISTQMTILADVPDGLSNKDMSPQCDPRRLEDDVLNKKMTLSQYYSTVKKYFSQCSGELTQNTFLGKLGLLKFSRVIYPFLSHPQISEFMIKLPDGTKVPGILAMKKDPKPRPLVIVKCGVFCSAAETSSLKNYMMHLFDQSPFNVLILANQTGMDYIFYNKRMTIGGWGEGYESLQVGKWMLEKWENRDRISSIHLMGISLGGNAAVLGASYNDKFPLASGKKVFNSVTAICPVVSLRPTLDTLYKSLIVGSLFTKMTKGHFSEASSYVTDVPDMLAADKFPRQKEEFTKYIGTLAVTSMNRRGIATDLNTFYKSTNFWNLKEEVKTPMLVWASKDDSVVNNRLNAAVVEHDDMYEKSANVGVVNLQYGDHCGFATAYGAQASATVLRTFVLQNSPEFLPSYNVKQNLPWKFGFKKMGPQYEHVGQTWKFTSGSDKVKVSFRVFNWSSNEECSSKGPWGASASCVTSHDYWVPLSSFSSLGARVPRTEAEAQALTREFNTKIEFRVSGHPLNGTNSKDFYMTWRSHFE